MFFQSMKDLPDHMEKNPDIWKEFCHLSNVTGSLPTPWNKLEPLEQLLIIKHLKPDCFTASISVGATFFVLGNPIFLITFV